MKYLTMTAVSALAVGSFATASSSAQSTSAYVGDVLLMASSYCPHNWSSAEGQLLSIATYQALYAVTGTVYGGDGVTTFALPDLRGRIPVHYGTGTGPGMGGLAAGQTIGRESVTLTEANLPNHTHYVFANTLGTDVVSPANATFSTFTTPGANGYENPPDTLMDDDIIGHTGSNAAIDLFSPSVGMRYCVNTAGLFPPRN